MPQRRTYRPPVGGAAAASRSRRRRALHERVLVLCVAALALMGATAGAIAGAVHLTDARRDAKAEEALHGTLARVFVRQGDFRRSNARFATWDELQAEGERLPPRQVVRRSTADQSHWFLSLRDQDTGIVCDRVGELFDDETDHPPSCRATP